MHHHITAFGIQFSKRQGEQNSYFLKCYFFVKGELSFLSNEEDREIVTYVEGEFFMIVALQKVQESEKEILRNLYALYLHDLSKFTMNITIGANGFF